MKRYLSFAGGHYYPSGGMKDFRGDFDSFDEAVGACMNYVYDRNGGPDVGLEYARQFCWAHVWDTQENRECWRLE